MKKAIILVVSAIVICLAGWFVGTFNSTTMWSGVLTFQHEIELNREAKKAFEAYKNEKKEIGIYSLQEFLDEIDHRQEIIGMEENEGTFTFYRIQTHCRLSKLYGEIKNEEKSEFHKMKAIEISEEEGRFEVLFTDLTFEALIDYFDSKEPTDENQSS
jgi:hypothetical protein